MGNRLTWGTVITDASWCPKTGAAGWACWIRMDGRDGPEKLSSGFEAPLPSSTEAEVRAAIAGITHAVLLGCQGVLIQSDCMAVIHLAQRKTFDQGDRWARSISSLMQDNRLLVLKARHVKGHTKDPAARSWVNRWCDKEASRYMRKMRAHLQDITSDDWSPIDLEDKP